jgi:Cyclic nucleotide-binding domain
MRIESSVVGVSWIPSEAVPGLVKVGFEVGMMDYDQPPPDVLGDLTAWRDADKFRFANDLRAWIEVTDGRITAYGQDGHGWIGSTDIHLAVGTIDFRATAYPDIRPEPEVGDGWVRFRQTAGGRTGAPMPRPVKRKPFVQFYAPTAWLSLALTIHADGRSEWAVEGASSFPRHWIYGPDGKLAAKSGVIDFKTWAGERFGDNTPWGGVDAPAQVAMAESALERELSPVIMGGGRPKVSKLDEGKVLTAQGDESTSIYLLLDGILSVEVDGEPVAEVGPGALLGERSVLEGGRRTATLRAVTPVKVAEARGVDLDRDKLAEISRGHRREERRNT